MTDTNASEGQDPTAPAPAQPAAAPPAPDTETQAQIADLRERIEQRDARNAGRPEALEAQLAALIGQQSEAFAARTEAQKAASAVVSDVEQLKQQLRESQARERATALGFVATADPETGNPQDHEALRIALNTPDPIATLQSLANLAPAPQRQGGRTIGAGHASGAAGGEDAIDRMLNRFGGNG